MGSVGWIRRIDGLELPNAGGPGESAAKRDEDDVVAALDSAGLPKLIEAQSDRAGGAVAKPINIHIDPVVAQAHALLGGIDDSNVGLVANELADLIGRQVRFGQSVFD